MKKENKPPNFIDAHAIKDKDRYYANAVMCLDNKDYVNAEEWAIRAMRAGSQNLAPKLLADIARSTRSKSTAITLASYYWDHKEIEQAMGWAKTAKEYGSINLADILITKINTYINAGDFHNEVGRLSK